LVKAKNVELNVNVGGIVTKGGLVIHADGSHGVRFLPPFVCVSVFLHDISITDAARITKLDIQMFHDKSWKPIYFGMGFEDSRWTMSMSHLMILAASFIEILCRKTNGRTNAAEHPMIIRQPPA